MIKGKNTTRNTHVLDTRNVLLDTLALAHLHNDTTGLGGRVERVASRKDIPMIEHGLGESLTTSGGTEICVEAEGLVDGKIGLDVEQRSTRSLLLVEDVTTAAGEDTVDTTHCLLGDLNLDEVDGLEERRLGEKSRSVQHTTGSRDDLSTTTMDSVGVQGNIHKVEADAAHGLLGDRTLTGGPLESRDDGVLDFVEVLNSLGLINQKIGTVDVGSKAPNLTGIGDVPAEIVSENTSTSLEVVTWRDLAALNGQGNFLAKRGGGNIETVVLVGRLGERSHAAVGTDGLTVRDNGRGDVERNTSVVLLKILQANLQMQFTSTSNNVLTRLGDHGQDARIGLGQTLKTLDKLGQITGVLHLNGDLDDGRDGELHDLQVVGGLGGGKGTALEQELLGVSIRVAQ